MFENQPKGLWALALANTGERFGYYTMLAVFLLYLQANFGFETGLASTIYSTFLMMVYFLPIIGGYRSRQVWLWSYGYYGYLHYVYRLSCALTPSWQRHCCCCRNGHFAYPYCFGNRSVQG